MKTVREIRLFNIGMTYDTPCRRLTDYSFSEIYVTLYSNNKELLYNNRVVVNRIVNRIYTNQYRMGMFHRVKDIMFAK